MTPLHGPGVVTRMAREYGIRWLTAWHWLNREAGLCANGCGPSEKYLCQACTKRHMDNRRQRKLHPRVVSDASPIGSPDTDTRPHP